MSRNENKKKVIYSLDKHEQFTGILLFNNIELYVNNVKNMSTVPGQIIEIISLALKLSICRLVCSPTPILHYFLFQLCIQNVSLSLSFLVLSIINFNNPVYTTTPIIYNIFLINIFFL